METTAIRTEFVLDYVVIKNDGVNVYFAEAGFTNKWDARECANERASFYEPFNPSDSDEVHNSASVAHYEVVHVHGDERDEEWETVYKTKSFYNE